MSIILGAGHGSVGGWIRVGMYVPYHAAPLCFLMFRVNKHHIYVWKYNVTLFLSKFGTLGCRNFHLDLALKLCACKIEYEFLAPDLRP